MYEKCTAESLVSHAYRTARNYKILCWLEKTFMETYIQYDGINRKCQDYWLTSGINISFPRCDLIKEVLQEVEDHCYVRKYKMLYSGQRHERQTSYFKIIFVCKLSKLFIFTILTMNIVISCVCTRWGPKLLSDNHKKSGCKQVKHFLQKFKVGGQK